MLTRKNYVRNLALAAFVAVSAVSYNSAFAAKAKTDYVLYEKEVNGFENYTVYNSVSGTTISVTPPDEPATDIEPGSTAVSNLLVSSYELQSGGGNNLYSLNLLKGTRTKLNPNLVSGGNVQSFEVTDSNKFVFYTADQDTDEKVELYYTSTKKSSVKKLASEFDDFTILENGSLSPLPNGKGVFYFAEDVSGDKTGLFLSLTNEALPRKIVNSTGNDNDYIRLLSVSPRSTGAVVRADTENSDGIRQLFYYDVKSKKLSEIVTPGIQDVSVRNAKFDPTGKFVVYGAYNNDNNSSSLYKYDIKSGTVTLLGEKMPAGNYIGDAFHFDSKGKTVYYTNDKVLTGTQVMYSIDLKKGQITRISDPDRDVVATMIDNQDNIYYAHSAVDDGTVVYKKPAKKGDASVFLDSSQQNAYLLFMQISATGSNLHYGYFFSNYDFLQYLKNLVSGELYNLDVLFPGSESIQILDSTGLEFTLLS